MGEQETRRHWILRKLASLAAALFIACIAAMNAAAPARAEYLYFTASAFGRYIGTASPAYTVWSSNVNAPGSFEYQSAIGVITGYYEEGREGYYFSSTDYNRTTDTQTDSFVVYYGYTNLIQGSTEGASFHANASFYIHVRQLNESLMQWQWNTYRCTYSNNAWVSVQDPDSGTYRQFFAIRYTLPDVIIDNDGLYFYLSPSDVPIVMMDTGNGDDEIVSGLTDVEEAIDGTTEAVEDNTQAIQDLQDAVMSTEGSDSVVSGVLSDSEEGWLCERLGFICTVMQIPTAIFDEFINGDVDETFAFPGINFSPFMEFSIPAVDVNVWEHFPSAVTTSIRTACTTIVFLLWCKGVLSLYRRFTGEEQTVQVENTGDD